MFLNVILDIPNSIFHIFSQLCFFQKRRYYNKIYIYNKMYIRYIRLNSMILAQSSKTYHKFMVLNDKLTWIKF